MRSRIAIFEGYRSPSGRYGGRSYGRRYAGTRYGGGASSRYGAPLFPNPRVEGLGRRAYTMPPLYEFPGGGRERDPVYYGPPKVKRKGYRVKKGRNSKAQVRFKKAAKSCSRRRSKRTSFQECMRKKLKKGKR